MDDLYKTNPDGNIMTTLAKPGTSMDGHTSVTRGGLFMATEAMGGQSAIMNDTEEARKEMDRKDMEKEEAEREERFMNILNGGGWVEWGELWDEMERKETESKEAEKKELGRKERKKMKRKEQMERKESERKETERKEMERKETERKETERKESERMEMERKEKERKEKERKEKERKEFKRKEVERKETERKEIERKESERIEMDRKEKNRKETERKESERMEMERKEAERKESEREMERKERERKETDRKKMERKELKRKEEVMGEKMCDRPGGMGATIIMDWASMMYRKRMEMERKETERKERERKETLEVLRKRNIELVAQLREAKEEIARFREQQLWKKNLGMFSSPRMKMERKENGRKETDRMENAVASIAQSTMLGTKWELVGGRRRWRDRPLPPLPDNVLCGEGCEWRESPLPPLPHYGRNPPVVLGDHRREGMVGDNRKRKVMKKETERKETERKDMESKETEWKESERKVIMGRTKGFSYAEALKRARQHTDREALGIRKTFTRLGWTMAGVESLVTRPLQCYRCWNYGHVRSMCHDLVDRRGACYKCGRLGHLAGTCRNKAYCAICHDVGLEAVHRMGGPHCGVLVQQQSTSMVYRCSTMGMSRDRCREREKEGV